MEKWTEHHHRIASALDVLLDSSHRQGVGALE